MRVSVFVKYIYCVYQPPTKNSDEERLIDQFVALWIFKVEFEGEAAPILSFFMDILQKALM